MFLIKALLHKRGLILKSKDYNDNNNMVTCLITTSKTHVKLTVMTDPGGEVIRYTHRLCLQYRGGGDLDDDDLSCGRVSLF